MLGRTAVSLALLWTLAGCGGDDGDEDNGTCTSGTEGCACSVGSSCGVGLSCLSSLCVRLSSDAGAPGVASDANTSVNVGPSMTNVCGDGVASAIEGCDGIDFKGATCTSATAGSRPSGGLVCTRSCQLDSSMCLASQVPMSTSCMQPGGACVKGADCCQTGASVGDTGSACIVDDGMCHAVCTANNQCTSGCCAALQGVNYGVCGEPSLCAGSQPSGGMNRGCTQDLDCGRSSSGCSVNCSRGECVTLCCSSDGSICF